MILAQVERRFMIRNKEEQLYLKKYQPFYNNLHNYLNTYIVPEVIAFYIASSYQYNCLSKYSLETHFRSSLSLFNTNCNIKELIPVIENILLIKYNLKITNINPLTLKKNT